jgi:hypothetical protein
MEALLDASKEVGLEVTPEKTKNTHMLMSRCKKAGQKQSIKTANRSFEGVQSAKKCSLSVRISCTRRQWTLDRVVPREIVCDMHVDGCYRLFLR